MKYRSNECLNFNLPFNITEMRNNLQLKSLWQTVLNYHENQERSIRFFFFEDYINYSSYLPYLLKLKQRIDIAVNRFGQIPRRRQCVIQDLNITSMGKIVERRPPKITIGTNTEIFNNFHRSIGLGNQTYLFEKTWMDNSSVLFVERACSYAENLIRSVMINTQKATDLVKTCKVDYNNVYDNNSSVILTSLKYLLTNLDIFEPINQARKIDAIVISALAIKDYVNEYERIFNSGNGIIDFWNFITDFAQVYDIPRIIISAAADKCLAFQNYHAAINDVINGYRLYTPEFLLTGDFLPQIPNKIPAKAILSFQDQDNYLYNYFRNIDEAWQILTANLFEGTYTINRQIRSLKAAAFSVLPKLETINSNAIEILNSVDHLVIPVDFRTQKEVISDNIGFICGRFTNIAGNYQEYINQYLAVINNETPILIISDNPHDMNLRTFFRLNNIEGITVTQIDWNNIDTYFEYQGKIVFSLDFLSYGIQCWERLFLLGLSFHKFNAQQYFLGSKSNLTFIHNAWHRFEDCINDTREDQEEDYYEIKFLNFDQFTEAIALAQHEIFQNIEQEIARRFDRYLRNAGYRQLVAGNPDNNDTNFISIYFEEDETPLINVPEGRIYYLDSENDDLDVIRKRAEELLPGDRIIVIFDDRDSTYERINEILINRNAEFQTKYNKSRIWLVVLKHLIETHSRNDLLTNLINNGMHPYHIQTVINWVNEGDVIPEYFSSVLNAILTWLSHHPDLFPGYQYIIGNVDDYIKLYTEVILTPRELYRAIIRNIKKQVALNPNLIRYQDVFNALSNNSRILTVQNIE